jgi:hypothetical protein
MRPRTALPALHAITHAALGRIAGRDRGRLSARRPTALTPKPHAGSFSWDEQRAEQDEQLIDLIRACVDADLADLVFPPRPWGGWPACGGPPPWRRERVFPPVVVVLKKLGLLTVGLPEVRRRVAGVAARWCSRR